jgi:hypothetical protein
MPTRSRHKFLSGRSGVEVSTTGVRAQVELMRRMGARGADARKAWPAVETIMREDEARQFSTGGTGKWPALADATKEWKSARGQTKGVMRGTDALYKSLTMKKPRGRWRRARKAELRWGTKLFYAFFHQQGHGVPVRKVIDVSEQASREMTREMGHYITYDRP